MVPFAALIVLHLTVGQGDENLVMTGQPWWDNGVRLAKRERLLWSYPDCEFGRLKRKPSRYELAVMLQAIISNHLEAAETPRSGAAEDARRALLLRTERLLPFYRKGWTEYEKELLELGVDRNFGIDRIASIMHTVGTQATPRQGLFSDVPADHWAGPAVGDLRALGLLLGYPDSKFRG